MTRALLFSALCIAVLTTACEPPVSSVTPVTGASAGSKANLPALGEGDANARIAALENYVQQLQSDTENRITQLQQQNAQLQQQLSTAQTQTSTTIASLTAQSNLLTAQATSLQENAAQLATLANNLPSTVCTSNGGTFSNNKCTLPTARVLFNNLNIFNCALADEGCLANTAPAVGNASMPAGLRLVSPWALPEAPYNYSIPVDANDHRLKTFSVTAGQCRMIELRVSIAAASHWNRDDNGTFNLRVLRNGQPISPNEPSENFIGWAYSGWGVQGDRASTINTNDPSTISVFKRQKNGEHEGDSVFRTRSWFITDPAQLAVGNTFSFTANYYIMFPTLATLSLICY